MDVNRNLPTIITTDGKVDDIIAFHILLPLLQNKRLLIVVGEHSNVKSKCQCLYSAFATMFKKYCLDVEFMRGTATTGHYPLWSSMQEGQTVPYLSGCKRGAIEAFIDKSYGNSCNIIALKPPRDLLNALEKNRKLFSKSYLYMSSPLKLSKLIMECQCFCTAAVATELYGENLWTACHLSSHCINSLILLLEHSFGSAFLFDPHSAFIADHSRVDHSIDEIQGRPVPPIESARLLWEEDPWKWHPYAVSLEKCIENQSLSKFVTKSSAQCIIKALQSFREVDNSNLILDSVGLAVFMTYARNTFETDSIHIDFSVANCYQSRVTAGYCTDTKLHLITTRGTVGFADKATYMLKSVVERVSHMLELE